MSKTYVAVQRSGQKQNELTHWKYIRKEKKNGKWRYYYKDAADKAKDVAGDVAWEIGDRIDTAKENFELGYEIGSKKDPNTGDVLNKRNINPEVYERYNDTLEKYRRTLEEEPFYRSGGYSEATLKELEHLREVDRENTRKWNMASSFMGNLGQVAGRSVTKITYNHNKVKNWLKKKLAIH